MNSQFIGYGVFVFLCMFGLSFVIDAVRRESRKPKREFNWGKLETPNLGSIFDEIDEVERDDRGRFAKKVLK